MRQILQAATTILVGGTLIAAFGCTTDLNARTTIGAKRTIAAFDAETGTTTASGPTTRLDRAGWAPVEFRLPVDGTVHHPAWRSRASFDDEPARQHGLYPTAESSLQLGERDGTLVWAGVIEPARALVDLFAMPVRMVLSPPWSRTQSPAMYKRWHAGEWMAGPLPEADSGEPGDGS